jgi:hypothetical protein
MANVKQTIITISHYFQQKPKAPLEITRLFVTNTENFPQIDQ